MIKTAIISRKQQSWSEESPYMDARLIDSWVSNTLPPESYHACTPV